MESFFDANQAQGLRDRANGQLNAFIDNVEDLTNALKDVDTPDIARVKAKVKLAVSAARSALADGATQVKARAREATQTTDAFVRDNPWAVVGIAALIGLGVGIFAGRRSD
jgi:ElaB/YqjD/DUF883 family membrane-anchored ribosome-binding protein